MNKKRFILFSIPILIAVLSLIGWQTYHQLSHPQNENENTNIIKDAKEIYTLSISLDNDLDNENKNVEKKEDTPISKSSHEENKQASSNQSNKIDSNSEKENANYNAEQNHKKNIKLENTSVNDVLRYTNIDIYHLVDPNTANKPQNIVSIPYVSANILYTDRTKIKTVSKEPQDLAKYMNFTAEQICLNTEKTVFIGGMQLQSPFDATFGNQPIDIAVLDKISKLHMQRNTDEILKKDGKWIRIRHFANRQEEYPLENKGHNIFMTEFIYTDSLLDTFWIIIYEQPNTDKGLLLITKHKTPAVEAQSLVDWRYNAILDWAYRYGITTKDILSEPSTAPFTSSIKLNEARIIKGSSLKSPWGGKLGYVVEINNIKNLTMGNKFFDGEDTQTYKYYEGKWVGFKYKPVEQIGESTWRFTLKELTNEWNCIIISPENISQGLLIIIPKEEQFSSIPFENDISETLTWDKTSVSDNIYSYLLHNRKDLFELNQNDPDIDTLINFPSHYKEDSVSFNLAKFQYGFRIYKLHSNHGAYIIKMDKIREITVNGQTYKVYYNMGKWQTDGNFPNVITKINDYVITFQNGGSQASWKYYIIYPKHDTQGILIAIPMDHTWDNIRNNIDNYINNVINPLAPKHEVDTIM